MELVSTMLAKTNAIEKPPRWMRRLRVAMGEVMSHYGDITSKACDYFMIDTYEKNTLAVVFFSDGNTHKKMKIRLKKKHNIDVVDEYKYNSRYGRAPQMHIFHCKIGGKGEA
jgi:hypothetical protein